MSKQSRIASALIALSALGLVSAAGAQTTTFTSPRGLDSTEGNAVFYFKLDRRVQSLDATNLGTVKNLKSLALRRDARLRGGSTGATAGVELKVGEATSLGQLSTNPERNFHGKPTIVLQDSGFRFPDWSQRPKSFPAAFSLKFPFKSPFLYIGVRPLVWDMTIVSGLSDILPVDRSFGSRVGYGKSVPGTACGAFQQRVKLGNNGAAAKNYGMFLACRGTGGPANAPALLSLDLGTTSVSVPGWCGKLAVLPRAILPFPPADTNGTIHERTIAVPFDNLLSGVTLHSQLVAIQNGGAQLSNAASTTMPSNRLLTGHDAAYLWLPRNETHATGISLGGTLVTQWSN